jgi:hypothetical protein
MDDAEAYRKTIESIKKGMECPRAFACCPPDCARPVPAHVHASGKLMECLEDADRPCQFAVDFGIGRFCECPLHTFLVQNPPFSDNGDA